MLPGSHGGERFLGADAKPGVLLRLVPGARRVWGLPAIVPK
jgi:hypothetical protein